MASDLTARLAAWVLAAQYEDLPEDVVALSRLQALSVVAASAAGARSAAGGKVARAAGRWGSYGPLFARIAASVAHDYDDYLFAAHTGHSAVWVSLYEGRGALGRQVLTAQAIGNEIGGRLGAALLFGPHNGQLWSCVHTLIAAAVAGRLRGLDEATLTNAFGIALYIAPYPLVPGFMGPESKLLTAALPALQGIMAVDLAQEGLTGARDILGGRGGMLRSIGRWPRTHALGNLGTTWLSRTLCFKLFPGCAYVDSAVEAVLSLDLRAEEVECIDVWATPLAWAMEAMSRRHAAPGIVEPITVNFSIAFSVAMALLDGRILPAELEAERIRERWPSIQTVASKVRVHFDPVGAVRALRSTRSLVWPRPGRGPTASFGFPCTVKVALRAGGTRWAHCELPRGAAGRPSAETADAVREKFLRETGDPEAMAVLEDLDRRTGAELWATVERLFT